MNNSEKPIMNSRATKKKLINAQNLNESLSLQAFLDYLPGKKNKSRTVQSGIASASRVLFEQFLMSLSLSVANSGEYHETFQLIERMLDLGSDHQQRSFNIFTMPGSSKIVHLSDIPEGFAAGELSAEVIGESLKCYLEENPAGLRIYLYKEIWEYYMPVPFPALIHIILPIEAANSKRNYFFQLIIDQRFVKVESTLQKEEIVKILTEVDLVANDDDEKYALLTALLPLHNFHFSGFKRIQVSDVSTDQIIKNITDQILTADQTLSIPAYLNNVVEALDILARSSDLDFGLFPMLRINGRFTFLDPRRNKGLMAGRHVDEDTKELLYEFLANIYRTAPKPVFLPVLTDEKTNQYQYLKILRETGIESFALIPIFHQQLFVGVLEIMTKKSDALTKITLSNLASFFPVLALHFKKSVDRFDQLLEFIVKEKFTSLQPSVQWRFNIAAWNYLQNRQKQSERDEVEKIAFEQVYPLYGAIDVKNSTVNRNNALRDDMNCQLGLLKETLHEVKEKTALDLLDEKVYLCNKWQQRVLDPSYVLLEEEINYFLEKEIYFFFKELVSAKPETVPLLQNYFSYLNADDGTVKINRQKLESSMNMVINGINDEIEKIQVQAQVNFPCFFEKFRTDGVEYDIYIGQSISPEMPFKPIFIQNLRLLQLKNMISIALKVHEMRPQLPVPIEITQLIFVQPHVIDITFRNDERRFDVEGAYNIRYHIVKKRIDKVLIKATSERLTIPGKIAIVYFNQKELDEFMVHINFLQQENLLTENTELLELEQLQGVVGLKAVRIEIKFPQNNSLTASLNDNVFKH